MKEGRASNADPMRALRESRRKDGALVGNAFAGAYSSLRVSPFCFQLRHVVVAAERQSSASGRHGTAWKIVKGG